MQDTATLDARRGHKLVTKTLAAALPALYATDGQGDSAVAHVKFFSPFNGWEWYATEYDPTTGTFFGLVKGFDAELGYFTLAELASAAVNGVPAVERDLYFDPTPLGRVR
jgi:hypothetical protein